MYIIIFIDLRLAEQALDRYVWLIVILFLMRHMTFQKN